MNKIKLNSYFLILSLFNYSCSYQKMNSIDQKKFLFKNLKLMEIKRVFS